MMSTGACCCGCGQLTKLAPYSDKNKGWVRGQPKRYLKGHHPMRPDTYVRRFWMRVDKTTSPDGCWLWTGSLTEKGYGNVKLNKRLVGVHRLAYQWAKGPIPEGLQIDHLCRVRHCVNPDHLEAVTLKVNVLRGVGITAMQARQTHCVQGHPFDGPNTAYTPRGSRVCRACKRDVQRRQVAKKKAAA